MCVWESACECACVWVPLWVHVSPRPQLQSEATEPGVWVCGESLHVGPDLAGSDTDSSSPPASLSARGLTPYCQCCRLNGDLFFLHSICHHLRRVSTSLCVCVSAPSRLSSLPSFLHSLSPGLSQLTAACQMFPQLQVHPSLNGWEELKSSLSEPSGSVGAFWRRRACRWRGLACRRHHYFHICQIWVKGYTVRGKKRTRNGKFRMIE